MNIIYLSGSPRKRSNTDYLLNHMLNHTGGEFIKLTDYAVEPCRSCWQCRKKGSCAINDDMKTEIIPKILAADALVMGSPVYFNNVTAQLKSFIDRTWSMRGKLRNKIGATVVVGRRYGAEGAIMAINAFFLKHEMIVANRGISGMAFRSGEIKGDSESIEAAGKLTNRVLELGAAFDVLKRGTA
ncbi:MAG: flavodoxin family protein [Thermodesulfobacteriota bacterium]|nr:flavodoxin family protein [Thermodesulfobacteriota bacterium]